MVGLYVKWALKKSSKEYLTILDTFIKLVWFIEIKEQRVFLEECPRLFFFSLSILRDTNDSLSLWQVVRVLQRFGSGQRSKGVWPFLFFSSRSAPWAARKQAIKELLFLSWPWVPRPISSRPTSCTSCSCRNCDKVWWRRASCSGVSPSLSATFRFAPSRTNNCWSGKVKSREINNHWPVDTSCRN